MEEKNNYCISRLKKKILLAISSAIIIFFMPPLPLLSNQLSFTLTKIVLLSFVFSLFWITAAINIHPKTIERITDEHQKIDALLACYQERNSLNNKIPTTLY
jgi:hypothetical protein